MERRSLKFIKKEKEQIAIDICSLINIIYMLLIK